MVHKTFYYARVSTREQNLDRQLEAFRALGADEREIITDKESGKNLDRPGYQALKSTMLRSGDTLVVKSLDRLSRSKADIHSELQWFKENNIHLKVIDLPTTMMDLPSGTGMGIRDGQQHLNRGPRHDRRAGAPDHSSATA